MFNPFAPNAPFLYPLTDRQTHRQTDTQTDRMTDRQKEREVKVVHYISNINI